VLGGRGVAAGVAGIVYRRRQTKKR
jgi:hypothetical protein